MLLLRFIQLTLVSPHTLAASSLATSEDASSSTAALSPSSEHLDISRVLVGVPSLLAAVARAFAAAQGEAKFDALCLLARLLEVDEQMRNSNGNDSASNGREGINDGASARGKGTAELGAKSVNVTDAGDNDDEEWVFAVRLALRDVLFSRFGRAKAPYRCAVLKCCGAFLRRRPFASKRGRGKSAGGGHGQQWAVRPWGTPEQSALFTSGQFVQVRTVLLLCKPIDS